MKLNCKNAQLIKLGKEKNVKGEMHRDRKLQRIHSVHKKLRVYWN